MAAANQCDNNMQGKPFFVKSILKATFIAQSYLECLASEPSHNALQSLLSYEECLQASTHPMDSFGLMTYDDWNSQNFGYYIQMFNTVIQMVDFHLEVVYPVDYISKSIPNHCPEKELLLALSRHVLNGEFWFNFIQTSLCVHPRRIACNLFDEALLLQDYLCQLAQKAAVLDSEKVQFEQQL